MACSTALATSPGLSHQPRSGKGKETEQLTEIATIRFDRSTDEEPEDRSRTEKSEKDGTAGKMIDSV